jgi:hypothetical protein
MNTMLGRQKSDDKVREWCLAETEEVVAKVKKVERHFGNHCATYVM